MSPARAPQPPIKPAAKRLFIAVTFPDALRQQLAAICDGLPDVRWVPEDQLHLTLRFIGDVPLEQVEAVQSALLAVRFEAFDMALQGVGRFPGGGLPRVIWAGLLAGGALNRLVRDVDRAVVGLGFPPESKRFVPHVTLARLKTPPPPAALKAYLRRHQALSSEPFRVDRFVLFSSQLHKEGPVYTAEVEYAARSE
jgi:2'-5' RNA ligase